MLFTEFESSEYFLRYDGSKSDTATDFLWEAQTKTAKKTISLKIYLLLGFLR